MSKFNYTDDISINPDELDIEWIRQSSLYMKYQEELAIRERLKTKAKENIEIVEAELDKKIRGHYSKLNIKVTEAVVKSEIIRSRERKDAFDDYVEKTYKYNIINGAIKAFEHKKKALEKLTDLYQNGYFSEPRSTHSKNIEERARHNMSEKVRKNIKRKK